MNASHVGAVDPRLAHLRGDRGKDEERRISKEKIVNELRHKLALITIQCVFHPCKLPGTAMAFAKDTLV